MAKPTTATAAALMIALATALTTVLATTPVLAAPVAQAAAADQPTPGVPVPLGATPGVDACPTLGSVAGVRTFLAVRAGPGVSYRQTDALHNGHMLFLCSASADGQWQGVVYAADPGLQECGVSSPVATPEPYRGPCKSGWVRATWVAVLAG